jgi:hypothetical protein
MRLVDLQRQMRDALVLGTSAAITRRLVGGQNASKRLNIHRRHYEASLTAAVVGRFPATGWLVGPGNLQEAARQFIHAHPPNAPCLAEYGGAFPAFLGTWPPVAHLTYVADFAELDFQLGRLALSVDAGTVSRYPLMAWEPMELASQVVTLQPGAHYVKATWPADTLMTLYLTDESPASWTLTDEVVHLELRGSHGFLRFSRLRAGEFAFRQSLAAGATLGEAVSCALEIEPTFEPDAALLCLLDEQLITAIGHPPIGDFA